MAPQTQPSPAIQAMDLTTLRAVLAELRPLLVPARFEKAQQPNPHTLQLGLRGLSGMRWLEISWMAEAPRLLAIPAPRRQGDGSTLAQQLQHGLKGLHLKTIGVPSRTSDQPDRARLSDRHGMTVDIWADNGR